MRIVLIGQAAFGARTLEALTGKGENIVAVYAPPDRGGKADPLKEAALSRNLPVFQPDSYRNDSVFNRFRELRPDLVVLAFVTDIIPPRFFDAAAEGAICYHPSLLPRHRGASAINWAVIMGDTRTGLTIFWPDGGIDTGPILLQKEVVIGSDDTTGSIYFNHLFPMGVDAIVESVSLIKAGRAPKIPQEKAGVTYEPPCNDKVAAIDWQRPAQEIYNLVRGCDPQPGAYTVWKGEKIRLFGVRLRDQSANSAPGTITAIDAEGIHVAVQGGSLTAGKLRPQTGAKMNGADLAAARGLRVGDRL